MNQFFTDLAGHARTHPGACLERWWPTTACARIGAFADPGDFTVVGAHTPAIRPDGHAVYTEHGRTLGDRNPGVHVEVPGVSHCAGVRRERLRAMRGGDAGGPGRVPEDLMKQALSRRVLPDRQRRTVEELREDLDFGVGDTVAKRSAFWTMLLLSAMIASAGVLADSTATVIGAMIIAPLSTPIMGLALGLATREPGAARRSAGFVLRGALMVIGVGVVFSFFVPGAFNLLSNGQIAGRTSPSLLDLVAAVATGFAGAVAFARRDVAAVLPGVAIAISLVPPLAVVGVCLGQGAFGLALGALLLFVSNLLSLILAGTSVYAVLGYAKETPAYAGQSRRRVKLVLAGLLVVVGLPLAVNTVAAAAITVLTARVSRAADEWVAQVPGASVESVDIDWPNVTIHVLTPGDLPSSQSLIESLDGQLPKGVPVVVTTSLGQKIPAGTVGAR